MKPLNRIILLLSFVLATITSSFAQDDVDKLLTSSAADGEKLLGAYVAPFMKSVSAGLNQGWYNTAKAHKIVGIDITITANAMTIPNKELSYNVNDLKLENITLVNDNAKNPDYPNVPTIFGKEGTPTYSFNDPNTGTSKEFQGPGGLDLKKNVGFNKIPVPMAQIGIGLPKGTDLKLRITPSIDLGNDAHMKMFGFGVMHDIKQWIPGLKLLPFDLSGFVGYTRLNIDSKFDAGVNGENQRGVFQINSTTIQGLISKKLSVLTVYGGIGYNIAKSKLAVKGTYDFNEDGDTNDVREKDPINLDYSTSGPRATAGFRLKLAILTLHTDYTIQKYNCLTVGLGLSVR
jgi:hypothetical protein